MPADLEGVSALFPRLKESRNQKFGSLSGGEQQIPAICRAFMGRPRLLMIEQNAGLAARVHRKCYVVEVGRLVLEGDANELIANDSAGRAHLG